MTAAIVDSAFVDITGRDGASFVESGTSSVYDVVCVGVSLPIDVAVSLSGTVDSSVVERANETVVISLKLTSVSVSVVNTVVSGSFFLEGSVGGSSVDGTPVAIVSSPVSVDVDLSNVVGVVMPVPCSVGFVVFDCEEPSSLIDGKLLS